MSIADCLLIAAGVVMNGLTFALGIAVGARLTRKDAKDDSYIEI
jgi:hypothetical protein